MGEKMLDFEELKQKAEGKKSLEDQVKHVEKEILKLRPSIDLESEIEESVKVTYEHFTVTVAAFIDTIASNPFSSIIADALDMLLMYSQVVAEVAEKDESHDDAERDLIRRYIGCLALKVKLEIENKNNESEEK